MLSEEVLLMNMALENVASGNPSLGRRRWWLLVPVFLLNLFSAYLFTKVMGAAAFYSAWGPITNIVHADKVAELVNAYHRAHVFFLYSVAVVALAALLMTPVIHLSRITSRGFRLVARYFLALVLCV